jgi:hypothetical protein
MRHVWKEEERSGGERENVLLKTRGGSSHESGWLQSTFWK